MYSKGGVHYQFSPWLIHRAQKDPDGFPKLIEGVVADADMYGCIPEGVQAGIPLCIPYPMVTDVVERISDVQS